METTSFGAAVAMAVDIDSAVEAGLSVEHGDLEMPVAEAFVLLRKKRAEYEARKLEKLKAHA